MNDIIKPTHVGKHIKQEKRLPKNVGDILAIKFLKPSNMDPHITMLDIPYVTNIVKSIGTIFYIDFRKTSLKTSSFTNGNNSFSLSTS